MTDEKPKPRGQMTIKSTKLGFDWQNAVRMAAERSKMPLGDWIVQTCWDKAQSVLTNAEERPETVPHAGVPARLADVTDKLAEMAQQLAEDAARRDAEQAARAEGLAEQLRREQAALRDEMRRSARRARWR